MIELRNWLEEKRDAGPISKPLEREEYSRLAQVQNNGREIFDQDYERFGQEIWKHEFEHVVCSLDDQELERILILVVEDERRPEVFLKGLLSKNYPKPKGLERDPSSEEKIIKAEHPEYPSEADKWLPVPAIDILAFYQPLHFYGNEGGIYIILDGLIYLAKKLKNLAYPAILDGKTAVKAAKDFLYSHEFFHHCMEMWAYRVEVCLRGPRIYLDGCQRVYDDWFLNPQAPIWNEEGLANAYASFDTISSAPKGERKILRDALIELLRLSPPGYNTGRWYLDTKSSLLRDANNDMSFSRYLHGVGRGGVVAAQRRLAEEYFHVGVSRCPKESFSSIRTGDPEMWQAFPHAFAGTLKSSCINILVSFDSPLLQAIACPSCGFQKYARLVPGFITGIGLSHDRGALLDKFDQGEIPEIICGDMISDGSPNAECLQCGHNWYSDFVEQS